MQSLNRNECIQAYAEAQTDADIRILSQNDLFYLLTVVMGRSDANCDFIFDRCLEVQLSSDNHIDLWARNHYKSTIITVAKTIQDILNDPEITVGIFSHTRPIAKTFLRQIMRELETNTLLQRVFPDILFENPKKDSRQWSEESGIIVNRQNNPKEATIEAWGLVDGQPTGKHFSLLIFDDVVTRESVTSTDMIKKTTSAWELALNLASREGVIRYIGTRYHAVDTYHTIMERRAATPRIRPATHNGQPDGIPMFLSREELDKKRREMGPYTFAAQMLQNPTADNAQGFKLEWLRGWMGKPLSGELDAAGMLCKDHTKDMNLYLIVDPASSKKTTSDYTVMAVVGLAADQNFYLVDGLRDRLNLKERKEKLFGLHKKHRPLEVFYEQYGMQSDIEHFELEMSRINYHFDITKLGGKINKEDRIRWLVPPMSEHKFFVPPRILYVDYTGKKQDLVADLKAEMEFFPVSEHDDVLDCISRIHQPGLPVDFPELVPHSMSVEDAYELEWEEEVHGRNPLAKWL